MPTLPERHERLKRSASAQRKKKGDPRTRERVSRLRAERRRAGWQQAEVWFDSGTAALLAQLRQPGEALHEVVRRALQALQAQDAHGDQVVTSNVTSSFSVDTLNYEVRLPALMARLWAMADEGLSHQKMANRLNAEREPTLSRRGQWQAGTVGKLLKAYPRHGC